MKKPTRKHVSQRLFEEVGQSLSRDQVDVEAGVIRHVKVLGRTSKNGREYSEQAVRDARDLYEGHDVTIDHDRKEPRRERGLGESFGVLRNCVIESDGVYGDLHYLKSHPVAPMLVERIQRFPQNIGLSHNAEGRTTRSGGRVIVESLSKLNCIDLVRNPATTNGMFESENPEMTKTIREIIESEFPETSKDCELFEMDGMGDMSVAMPNEAASGDEAVWSAFRQAMMSVIDDESLDTAETIKKLGKILKAHEQLSGKKPSEPPAASESTSEGEGMAPEMESLQAKVGEMAKQLEKLLESAAKSEQRNKAMIQINESGLLATSALVESVLKIESDEKRREFLSEQLEASRKRPTEKPVIESVLSKSETKPRDLRQWVSGLKG
jgi:hypothetical protein